MKALAYASILKTGPGTSIQDLGRLGKTKYGIPQSGAMDQRSSRWVNHLLQNEETAAVLEISQPGLSLQFSAFTCLSLAGAVAEIRLNGSIVLNPSTLLIQAGDRLDVGAFSRGSRLYLAINGGFLTEELLGSRSFFKNLTKKAHLEKGDSLPYRPLSIALGQRNAKARWNPDWYQTACLQVYPGPDYSLLSEALKRRILQETFTLSRLSDRMGAQLSEILPNELPELPTNSVAPGLVQLTSGGKLLVLLRDAQVTGGYPRILLLDELSQWVMGQKKPGETLRFVRAQDWENTP